MPEGIKILLRSLLLILAQVWVLDHVVLLGTWMVLFIYPLAIIKLPMHYGKLPSMLIGFAIGLTIDFFTGTYGLNASCGLILGYFRQRLMRLLSSKDDADENVSPNLYYPGVQWFVILLILALAIHSLWYFNVSQFGMSGIIKVQIKGLISAFGSLVVCLVVEALFSSKKRRI